MRRSLQHRRRTATGLTQGLRCTKQPRSTRVLTPSHSYSRKSLQTASHHAAGTVEAQAAARVRHSLNFGQLLSEESHAFPKGSPRCRGIALGEEALSEM